MEVFNLNRLLSLRGMRRVELSLYHWSSYDPVAEVEEAIEQEATIPKEQKLGSVKQGRRDGSTAQPGQPLFVKHA
jgi:hypothetical protein